MKRTTRFRELLRSPELELLLEAHNGISAEIGEEAGFNALWAGGLCMSAQFGVRDSNEVSWTQVLEMLEFMADATTLPILMDGDTGYGNFNNDIVIYAGQGDLSGRVFRISHMGDIDAELERVSKAS